MVVFRPGSQNFLDRRTLDDRCKRRILFDGRELFVAFILGFAQIDQAALQISGLGIGFRKQEVELPAIADGPILQDRSISRTVTLKQLWIHSQRLAERTNGLLVFLVFEIGISQIAVQDRHVIPYGNGLLVSLDGFSVFLALVVDGADIVLRVGIGGIQLGGAFITFQRLTQDGLLVHGNAQLVEVNRVLRVDRKSTRLNSSHQIISYAVF